MGCPVTSRGNSSKHAAKAFRRWRWHYLHICRLDREQGLILHGRAGVYLLQCMN